MEFSLHYTKEEIDEIKLDIISTMTPCVALFRWAKRRGTEKEEDFYIMNEIVETLFKDDSWDRKPIYENLARRNQPER